MVTVFLCSCIYGGRFHSYCFFYSENDDMQNVFLFLSVGLVVINLILMEFMQNTIEKEERIKNCGTYGTKSEKSYCRLSGSGRNL